MPQMIFKKQQSSLVIWSRSGDCLKKLGPLTFGDDEREVFLGHAVTRHKEISETTSGIIDAEVRDIIDRNYKRALKILKENMSKLHVMAEALIKYETISYDQIQDVMDEKPVRDPIGWSEEDALKRKKTIKDSETVGPVVGSNLKADSFHDENAN